MTITYTGKVANARLGSFSRLIFYWRGSIYKLMYKEMIIFCVLYAALSLVYRLALKNDYKRVFENIALYCQTFTDLIPMSFILGFYVSIVVTRWWNQYMMIPWPDRIMMYLTTCVDGDDTYGRLVRRTIVRYLTLGSIIVFQSTTISVKKRFPTMEHVIEAGIITESEAKELEEVDSPHGVWWIPFLWISNILKDAKKQGRICDSFVFKTLMDEVMLYRGNLGQLYSYDWISVPLVYTQVTTLAVYIFFLGALFGRQFLDPSQGYAGHTVDLYVPFFTLLQFFFYMGWLKVAEQLINPFGEDDDDFEMNWIIDRNLQISLLSVDDLYGKFPALEKDMYYGEHPPERLPYTKSSISTRIKPHMGSTADLGVSPDGMRTINPMDTIQETVATSNHGNSTNQMINLMSGLNTPHARTPLPSPTKQKHYYQNLMTGMRSPLNISKSTMEGGPFGSQSGRFHVNVVNEATPSKAQSYIEHWLHRAEDGRSALRPGSFNTAESSPGGHVMVTQLSRRSSVSGAPDDGNLMFNMEVETAQTHGENVDVNRGDVNRSDVNRGDVNRSDVNRGDVNRRHIARSPTTDIRSFSQLQVDTSQAQPTHNHTPDPNPTSLAIDKQEDAANTQLANTQLANMQLNANPSTSDESGSVVTMPTEQDRSRHTSSDGSVDYIVKATSGMATVNSLTPLLTEMDTMCTQSKI